jgi:hypothetical protein
MLIEGDPALTGDGMADLSNKIVWPAQMGPLAAPEELAGTTLVVAAQDKIVRRARPGAGEPVRTTLVSGERLSCAPVRHFTARLVEPVTYGSAHV